MSSKAGPSKTSTKAPKVAKAKVSKAPEVAAVNNLSNETVESDDDLESRDQGNDDDSSSSSEEEDSDEDLEDIQPKQKSTAQVNGKSKQSGSAWPKYQPPNGMAPVNVDTRYTDSPFEWDALASKPNVELWAIRVPTDLKSKYLSSLKISRPTSSTSSETLGTLETRSKTYNLVTAGQTHKVRQAVNSEGRVINAGPSAADVMRMDVDTLDKDDLRREGGEEMEGMTLMVPRFSKKGKLYAAPKQFTRHLILEPDQSITAEPASASASHSNGSAIPSFLSTGRTPAVTIPTPVKRVQPTHLLKFRNKTVGYDTPGPGGVVEVAATREGVEQESVEAPVEKKKRRKSEKGDGETPKKKKTKV